MRTPRHHAPRLPYVWTTPAPYVLGLCVAAVAYDYTANPQGFVRFLVGFAAYVLHR